MKAQGLPRSSERLAQCPTMSLTADLVALCHRDVPEPPRNPDLVRFSDADYNRAAAEVLARLGDDPIWVFAYGSLVWKPASDIAEQRLGTAFGWHRSFCIEMRSWRGSPEQPGLMMALRQGGSCTGVAQRPLGDDRHEVMVKLLRREIGGPMGYAALRLIDIHADDGPRRALCFYAEPPEVADRPELPIEKVASILARACGHVGSGAEYLFRTVEALQAVGIHDPHLWQLQRLVANEIRTIHFGRSG
jgi:glutathione-specific gamma-glutamylcyclotransferase